MLRLIFGLLAFAVASLASLANAAAQCNPYQASCRTTIAPDAPFTGPLLFAITSSGCSGFAGGGVQEQRTCINSITLAPGTTIEQKCTALVAQINATCGTAPGQGNFQADGSACAMTGTFTVTDLTCNGQSQIGTGVTLMLGNSTLQGSGMLEDYEQDTISNGCQGSADSMAILNGTPTGSAINGSQSSTIFIVSTPAQSTVIATVLTNGQMTPAAIVADGVSKANLALTALHSNVHCNVDATTPTVASCAILPADGSPPADGARVGVPVSLQVNDTGLSRFVMAGPSQDIQSAKKLVNAKGGVPANLRDFNFVGGMTCAPCSGGISGPNCCVALNAAAAPALASWHIALLLVTLVALGLAWVARARPRSPEPS